MRTDKRKGTSIQGKPTTPSAERISELIEQTCVIMGTPESAVMSRDRRPATCTARHAVMFVLCEAGLSMAEVGRRLSRDHATITHGMKAARRQPEWPALLLPLLRMPVQGKVKEALEPALRSALNRHAPELNGVQRYAIRAYATCTLLGWRKEDNMACWHGLRLVALTPGAFNALAEVLQDCGLGEHTQRIKYQARAIKRDQGAWFCGATTV